VEDTFDKLLDKGHTLYLLLCIRVQMNLYRNLVLCTNEFSL